MLMNLPDVLQRRRGRNRWRCIQHLLLLRQRPSRPSRGKTWSPEPLSRRNRGQRPLRQRRSSCATTSPRTCGATCCGWKRNHTHSSDRSTQSSRPEPEERLRELHPAPCPGRLWRGYLHQGQQPSPTTTATRNVNLSETPGGRPNIQCLDEQRHLRSETEPRFKTLEKYDQKPSIYCVSASLQSLKCSMLFIEIFFSWGVS